MSLKNKFSSFMSRVEIVLAIVLFFCMLISCGLYINIKINGKSANLPSLSDTDKQLMLRPVSSENVKYEDDLIEPAFIGLKRQGEMLAAIPYDISSLFVESDIYDVVNKLFSGKSEKMTFSNEEDCLNFVDEIKNSDNYVLMTFFCDMPSSVFLPCMLDSNASLDYSSSYDVRYLFILSDMNGDVYGVAFSSDYETTVITCTENISFNKISDKAYDEISNWSEFAFDDALPISPVLVSSFNADKYLIESVPSFFGKDNQSIFVQALFEKFSINSNLVKSFTSGDGSEINFVEEPRELVINDNGLIIFNSGEGEGVLLDDYIGYYSAANNTYSFSDKMFALKSFINSLGIDSDISFSIIGLDYNDDDSSLKVYFKYLTDGCFVTDKSYDAVFKIVDNSLTAAEFFMLQCDVTGEKSVVFPQNYASAVLTHGDLVQNFDSVFCPVLVSDIYSPNIKVVRWSKMSFSGEEE